MKSAKIQWAVLTLLIVLVSCTKDPIEPKVIQTQARSQIFGFDALAPASACDLFCESSAASEPKAHLIIQDVHGTSNLAQDMELVLWHTEAGEALCNGVQGEIYLTLDDGNYISGTYSGDGIRCTGQVEIEGVISTVRSAGLFRTPRGTRLNLKIEGIFSDGDTEAPEYQVAVHGELNKAM